ncbi:hypothetical protein [Streptomyces sp. B15]|uniref:hypothetical protein n=1 Tax=Streptomyces sp. B15 TaxID=1537797 RepID=UPI0027DCFCE4|nr:hypothetical protein [Streptomyces sp. B15]
MTDRGRQVARGMDAADIERKVRSGERLSREDGIALYGCDDLAWLGGLAHEVRTRHSGDVAYFAARCPQDVTDLQEAVALAPRWAADGVTELRLGAGTEVDGSTLAEGVRVLRAALPEGLALTAYALRYGGAGAPVDPVALVEQLLRLRELQDETGGFHVAVPLLQDGPQGATGAEVLKAFAVARLLLDNVPHLAADWALHTEQTAQLALQHGADELTGRVVGDDVDDAVVEVVDDGSAAEQDAGALTREDLLAAIRDAGFRPVERDAHHGAVRSHEGPDPQRRESPQPMRV